MIKLNKSSLIPLISWVTKSLSDCSVWNFFAWNLAKGSLADAAAVEKNPNTYQKICSLLNQNNMENFL